MTKNNEIVNSRIFDAPRELVFAAFTDQKHVEKWWGPRGFTNDFTRFEVKPGGMWLFTMNGPDGKKWPNKIVFQDVKRPELLAFAHGDPEDNDVFQSVITFEEQGKAKTLVTMRATFKDQATRDAKIKYVNAQEGGAQTLDRLAEHLARAEAGGDEFVAVRSFKAPKALVWQAWTDQAALAEWMGPRGLTSTYAKLDLRSGGSYHYALATPDGQTMWGLWQFREVTPTDRLVWINQFSDENGGLTRHPMAPDWPAQMLTTVDFSEQLGRTVINLRWTALNPTPVEAKVFRDGMASMDQGWGGTFEQLAAYLTKGN